MLWGSRAAKPPSQHPGRRFLDGLVALSTGNTSRGFSLTDVSLFSVQQRSILFFLKGSSMTWIMIDEVCLITTQCLSSSSKLHLCTDAEDSHKCQEPRLPSLHVQGPTLGEQPRYESKENLMECQQLMVGFRSPSAHVFLCIDGARAGAENGGKSSTEEGGSIRSARVWLVFQQPLQFVVFLKIERTQQNIHKWKQTI